MRRRDLIVGLLGLGTLAGGAILVTRGPRTIGGEPGADDDDTGESTDGATSGGTDTEGDDTADTGGTEPPFEIRTIDAPGSEAGAVTLPEPERVTVVNFTRTECPTSEGHLTTLTTVREDVADDVRFLSIVDVRSPRDTDEAFAEWWAEHDGNWHLGVDDGGEVNGYFDVVGFPTTLVIDGEGTVHWRNRGDARVSEIVEAIERAHED